MKKVFLLHCLALCLSLLPLTVAAGNIRNGESQYMEKCDGRCHDTRVHTRPNRIIHTYEDLVNRVRFCDNQAKTQLNEQDIVDVSEYLNSAFYKFLKVKSNE